MLPTELTKPKNKLTLIVPGGGSLGNDVRKTIVTRGLVNSSPSSDGVLAYSEPRKQKMYRLTPLLNSGIIILRGHEESRPIFESHIRSASGSYSMLCDGTGGRFVDYNGEGAEALIAYLKKHLLLHTLTEKNQLTLIAASDSSAARTVVDPEFKAKLLAELGEPLACVDEATAPQPPARVSLLSPKMVEQLRAQQQLSPPKPTIKLFLPEGAATWLLCSMEDDGDTLWAICDLGMGCVEYGTVSLEEIERLRTKLLKLPAERDRHFAEPSMTFEEILALDSLSELR